MLHTVECSHNRERSIMIDPVCFEKLIHNVLLFSLGNAALEVLLGENVLSELFDDDSGTDSPNPSSHYQLRKVGIDSFRRLVGNVGFAYSWAQRLCGLDFITEVDTYVSSPCCFLCLSRKLYLHTIYVQ